MFATTTRATTSRTLLLVAVILGSLASSGAAQATSESPALINPKDITWSAAPPSMPQGAKIAVLQGDPSKPGPFVIRLMVPPGYKIPPHWHTQDESLTVISGTFYFGTGDKVDTSNAPTITTGAFHFLSGKDHHYLVAKSQAVIQINGNGPFDVTYINSEDDLQAAKQSSRGCSTGGARLGAVRASRLALYYYRRCRGSCDPSRTNSQ